MTRTLILLTALLLVSCNDETPSKPSTPVVVEPSVQYAWNNKVWDKHLEDAIKYHGLGMLTVIPKDWNDFIDVWPSNQAGLVKFYGKILVEMSKWESKWNTETSYKENFKDRNGKYIYSRGLFQLSIESGRGYKCDIPTAKSLHEPKTNITCAVRILNRWVTEDNVISGKSGTKWRGGARYWAVLRGHTKYTIKALKAIKLANRS